MRIGVGYDSHRFSKNRRLIIGGVEIPYERGLLGHSDGDPLCHAMIDSILGAAGLGNIGDYFPSDDMRWKDARSTDLLKMVVSDVKSKGFRILWLDSIIIAQEPKINPYIEKMKDELSLSGIERDVISIKAKTNEGMGFIGRGEGIAVISVCLID